MLIAICEDNLNHSKVLEEYILYWCFENGVYTKIVSYSSAEDYLFDRESGTQYDILILNVNLRKMSGLELAKKIRENNDSVVIIFVSSLLEYAIHGYKYGAIRYLQKPVAKEQLFDALDKAKEVVCDRERVALMIGTNGRKTCVPYRNIVYLEQNMHYLSVHCDLETISFRAKISDLEARLPFPQFCRNHRTTIVHLKFVHTIGNNEVELRDHDRTKLPVSKGGWISLSRAFQEYYGKGGGITGRDND